MTAAQPTSQPAAQELAGVARLRDEARRLAPIAKSQLARRFLEAVFVLPSVKDRRVLRDPETREFFSEKGSQRLAAESRAKLVETAVTDDLYYNTRFGTPLVYVRLLDILAEKTDLSSLAGRKVLDFGYGSIGQLRLMAELGAEACGADVMSLLWAMYEADQGPYGRGERKGRVTVVNAQWPADAEAVRTLGGDFDLITSKNTLKNGYINPAKPVDKRHLVDLGADHAAFVKAMFDALKSDGLVLIYNLCPAEAAADEQYIPWADGRCPFPRSMLEEAGFEIIAFDEKDDQAGREIFEALGYPTKKKSGEPDLFVWYTLLRRPK